jgi:DNA-binding NarL/FixJ family response regulator
MPEPIKVLIVDDHPVVRDGLVSMLATQPDFNVVGEAASGSEAVAKANHFKPDVVLLDLEMPDIDGVDVLKRFQDNHMDLNTIVFTAFDTDDRIVTAIQAGAKGYLLKGSPREELFQAIRVVSKGGSLLQPVVASKLIRHMRGPSAGSELFEPLTSREQEVLNHLAEGSTNKEIAAELFITERTVKFHVSSILSKLGAGNRTEAVRIAAHNGLVKL